MRQNRLAVAAMVVSVLALALAMVGPANAVRLLSGKDIKNHSIAGKKLINNTLTGKQIKESTLKAVPKAQRLTLLPSGKSESGAFSGGDGDATSGWFGVGITYQQPLATAIANNHIIDTFVSPDTTHCPGPGHAAAGYLCLYFNDHSGAAAGYGYSTNSAYPSPSVGAGLYFPITSAPSYADGSWTVTAP